MEYFGVVIVANQADKQQQVDQLDERKRYAKEKIYNLIRSYPKDTQDEWVVFGYGGVRVTIGDLRDLFGVDR
jgi:hypothetical protein